MTDAVLYRLSKRLARSQTGMTVDQRAALATPDTYDAYRAGEAARVLAAVERYQVAIAGRRVLDLGCNDGALTVGYLQAGAASVAGVDIDRAAVARAQARHGADARVRYVVSTPTAIPLPTASVDLVLSYDVLEHVENPPELLADLHRVLAPGGRALIGCWGWGHPFAHHLGNMIPVPWAHLLVSERTFLRACRRVYLSDWYQPSMYDVDAHGQRIPDRFSHTAISRAWLNHYWIRDFERAFAAAGFAVATHLEPFGRVPWTRPLLRLPLVRELLAGYAWFVLSARA